MQTFIVEPINKRGSKVIVEINTSIYNTLVDQGDFIFCGQTLMTLWQSLGEPVILVWEYYEKDSIYRPKWDINIKDDGTIIIEKETKEGSRRVDVKIV
jgi:hypothetical protein